MTKAEAIAMLKRIQEPEAWEPQISQAAFEALDTAIKALEQEPCEDTISRQAAIDAIDEIEAEVADGYGYQYAKWREYFAEMPSAQPEIIRCKDCKWYGRVDKRRFYRGMDCLQKHIDTIVPDRDFCSKAERRGKQDG